MDTHILYLPTAGYNISIYQIYLVPSIYILRKAGYGGRVTTTCIDIYLHLCCFGGSCRSLVGWLVGWLIRSFVRSLAALKAG